MTFLIVGAGLPTLPYQEAFARVTGERTATVRLDADQLSAALRRQTWAGVILCQPGAVPAAAMVRVLQAGLPVLLADPTSLTAGQAAYYQTLADAHPANVTVGWFSPVSPGMAALSLEMVQNAAARVPISVHVEQQLPADATDPALRQAVLESVVTLGHLAGWPERLAAVAGESEPRHAVAVFGTTLSRAGVTGALTVTAGPGLACRRVRVVMRGATVELDEAGSRGVVSVYAASEPLAMAAGAEAVTAADRPVHLDIPVLDPVRAIVERFLRRAASGGADDLATLTCGLTVTEGLWESIAAGGDALHLAYRREVQESPRLRLLRGGRPDSAPSLPDPRRALFTIVH